MTLIDDKIEKANKILKALKDGAMITKGMPIRAIYESQILIVEDMIEMWEYLKEKDENIDMAEENNFD